MICNSVQPGDRMFVKDCGFLSFEWYLSGTYSHKLLYHDKKSATDTFKITSIRVIQKTTEKTGDLTGYKIGDRIINISKVSPQNNSETVTN